PMSWAPTTSTLFPYTTLFRSEGRIGGAPLVAQRRQHDRLHRLEALQRLQQHRIVAPGAVVLGRRHELVVEAEPIEERPRPGVVRSEEHTSELQSRGHLVCRLL